MANEIETQTGQCSTHGTVEATRDMPKMGFPVIYFSVKRYFARRRPYLCPECGEPVAAD